MPRARVGIVSWNTAPLLGRCLDALPQALGGLEASVVVVDNASSDASAEVVRCRPWAQLITNSENLGYAKAMNQALGDSGADVLIALNPDTEPPPGSLATLVERLLSDDGVGLVAPRLIRPDGSPQHSAYSFPSLRQAAAVCLLPAALQRGWLGRRLLLEAAPLPGTACDVDWLTGAVHVIRARAVDASRPYPERWFMYVEDLDLCWRLAKAGWRRRYEADVEVPHVGGASATKAWGDRAQERWMPLSYRWYADARGLGAMRRWAALNTAGTATRAASRALAAASGRRGACAEAASLARQLRLHAAALLAPPVLDQAPHLTACERALAPETASCRHGQAESSGPRP